MASSRDIVKTAGRAATEAALRAAMPDLLKQVAHLQTLIEGFDTRLAQLERAVDTRIVQVEQKIDDRFNRLLDAINQLHERIMRVEAKVDAYTDISRQQLGSTQNLI